MLCVSRRRLSVGSDVSTLKYLPCNPGKIYIQVQGTNGWEAGRVSWECYSYAVIENADWVTSGSSKSPTPY
jgi:hypothetical protein